MKNFTIAFAFLSLSSLTYAAPSTPHIKAREFEAAIFFTGTGPDPATYFQLFPTDDTVYPINSTLIVAQISSPGGAICNFFGANGTDVFLNDAATVDVSPPEMLVSGVCDVA